MTAIRPLPLPFPDVSVVLGGGGPDVKPAAAAPVASLGSIASRAVVTSVFRDDELGHVSEMVQVGDIIVGADGLFGHLLVSSNGKRFVRRRGTADESNGVHSMAAFQGGLVMVGESGTCAVTTDLGKTYTRYETGHSDELYGVATTDQVVWLGGEEGYLARMVAGEIEKVAFESEERQVRIAAIAGQLWVIGDDATLRILDDDGQLVRKVELGADGPLCSLVKTRSGVVVVVGDGGFITRSADGASFTRIEIEDLDADLEHIIQLAGGELLIVGGDGCILLSSDDGATWLRIENVPDDSVHLWSALPFGPGALIGGDDGAIWKLAPKGDATWADRADAFAGEKDYSDEDEVDEDEDEDDEASESNAAPNLSRSVDELELSVRTANCLQNAQIQWIGQLVQRTEDSVLKEFGNKPLAELKEILAEMGLTLGMNVGGWMPPD